MMMIGNSEDQVYARRRLFYCQDASQIARFFWLTGDKMFQKRVWKHWGNACLVSEFSEFEAPKPSKKALGDVSFEYPDVAIEFPIRILSPSLTFPSNTRGFFDKAFPKISQLSDTELSQDRVPVKGLTDSSLFVR